MKAFVCHCLEDLAVPLRAFENISRNPVFKALVPLIPREAKCRA